MTSSDLPVIYVTVKQLRPYPVTRLSVAIVRPVELC